MRTWKGICLGLVFTFLYGLLPGFFILGLLGLGSSSFLPGVSRMMESTFGPVSLILISIIVGMVIFPVAGAIWFSKDKKWTKTRLALITLLTHMVICYGLLMIVTV